MLGATPFQSTPAIADGRTGDAITEDRTVTLFQSTPAIADGRTVLGFFIAQFNIVSIHARHR